MTRTASPGVTSNTSRRTEDGSLFESRHCTTLYTLPVSGNKVRSLEHVEEEEEGGAGVGGVGENINPFRVDVDVANEILRNFCPSCKVF